jgi:RNA polymerase sigma-B factor
MKTPQESPAAASDAIYTPIRTSGEPMTATRDGTIAPPSPTDPTDVNQLALRWRHDADRRAREELFERFRPLARRLAGRYASPNEPLEDLAQVAYVGLLGAVDRFDPERGVRFSSFAIPTILGELKRYFRNTGWSVHVPRGAQEMALRIDRASRRLAADTGRAPRVQEVAQYLEVSVEDVIVGLDAGSAHYSVSLDSPVPGADSEESQSLGDGLGHRDEGYEIVETRLSLAAAASNLPHLERRALSLRLEEDLKQSEIAERMGCSQMQVSRLLRRAQAHLRELTDPDLRTNDGSGV